MIAPMLTPQLTDNLAFPKRAIHLDFHTMPGVTDVGAQFDETDFVETLAAAHAQYVTVFARCNNGFAYYPTGIGIPHPGLHTDLLGSMVESLHSRNIEVAAYFNVRLSHEEAILHPEWCRVNEKGQIFDRERFEQNDHFFRELCLNTGYATHLLSMISEVGEGYSVDGIFLDCVGVKPCWCTSCVQGRLDLGCDAWSEDTARQYSIEVFKRFQRDVEEIIRQSGRLQRVYFNGIAIAYREQPGHIEIETLPAAGWGYEGLPWQIRYARTLGKPILAMTGRFQTGWGDFGGLLPEHSMLYDCLLATSLGASCSIGDHLHPRGRLEPRVYERIGRVFSRLKALDPWTTQAKPLAEVLILEPHAGSYPQRYFDDQPLHGARRLLSELHHQFDISDGSVDFSTYRVILLPDHTVLTDEIKRRLLDFVESGGRMISSAHAGLEGGDFFHSGGAFRSYGEEIYNPAYFVVKDTFAPEIAGMPIAIYEPGIQLNASPQVEVLARFHQPYFNRGSRDGQQLNLYTPPKGDAGRPALIRSGAVHHFSFPIFRSYFCHALETYRELLRHCLNEALPRPLITSDLPRYVQIALTRQPSGRLMIHMLAYLPEMRGAKLLADEPLHAPEGRLTLHLHGQSVTKVTTAPDGNPVPHRIGADLLEITSPCFTGHQLLIVE